MKEFRVLVSPTKQLTLFDLILQSNFINKLFDIRTQIIDPLMSFNWSVFVPLALHLLDTSSFPGRMCVALLKSDILAFYWRQDRFVHHGSR